MRGRTSDTIAVGGMDHKSVLSFAFLAAAFRRKLVTHGKSKPDNYIEIEYYDTLKFQKYQFKSICGNSSRVPMPIYKIASQPPTIYLIWEFVLIVRYTIRKVQSQSCGYSNHLFLNHLNPSTSCRSSYAAPETKMWLWYEGPAV